MAINTGKHRRKNFSSRSEFSGSERFANAARDANILSKSTLKGVVNVVD
jgi:hypothetical protein